MYLRTAASSPVRRESCAPARYAAYAYPSHLDHGHRTLGVLPVRAESAVPAVLPDLIADAALVRGVLDEQVTVRVAVRHHPSEGRLPVRLQFRRELRVRTAQLPDQPHEQRRGVRRPEVRRERRLAEPREFAGAFLVQDLAGRLQRPRVVPLALVRREVTGHAERDVRPVRENEVRDDQRVPPERRDEPRQARRRERPLRRVEQQAAQVLQAAFQHALVLRVRQGEGRQPRAVLPCERVRVGGPGRLVVLQGADRDRQVEGRASGMPGTSHVRAVPSHVPAGDAVTSVRQRRRPARRN